MKADRGCRLADEAMEKDINLTLTLTLALLTLATTLTMTKAYNQATKRGTEGKKRKRKKGGAKDHGSGKRAKKGERWEDAGDGT